MFIRTQNGQLPWRTRLAIAAAVTVGNHRRNIRKPIHTCRTRIIGFDFFFLLIPKLDSIADPIFTELFNGTGVYITIIIVIIV